MSTTSDKPTPKKRHRPPLACEQCRRRKLKCNREQPCERCIRSKSDECTYIQDDRAPMRNNSKPLRTDISEDGIRTTFEAIRPAPVDDKGYTSDATASSTQGPPPMMWTASTPGASLYGNAMLGFDPMWSPGKDITTPDTSHTSTLYSTAGDFRTPSIPANNKAAERFILPERTVATNRTSLKGVFSKSRYFGQSHWMNTYDQFEYIFEFQRRLEADGEGEIMDLFDKCKKLGRQIKTQSPMRKPLLQDLREYVPTREIADSLLDSYLRTFETVFRILHVPSFRREYESYWVNPPSASTSFIVTLLLVLSIGTCFERNRELRDILRLSAMQWIHVAQTWLNHPFAEKQRMNVAGIQIHCLLLIARETNAIGADLTWISAGSLLRTAMFVGLHRDPAHLNSITFLEAEVRRRLWATILEITLESCITAGGNPLITLDDFDTNPPLNLNDSELEQLEHHFQAPPPGVERHTDTEFQLMLLKTFPLRLKITQVINSIKSHPAHGEMIELGTQFDKDFSAIHNRIASHVFRFPLSKPLLFQKQFANFLHARFTLLLHHPFAVKATQDPACYYSRHMCQVRSLHVLLRGCAGVGDTSGDAEYSPDIYALVLLGSGMFRAVMLQASLVLFLELLTQLQENPFPPSADPLIRSWEEMWKALEMYNTLAVERIQHGETNVKGYIFSSALLASLKAMMSGEQTHPAMLLAAKSCLQYCRALLQDRVVRTVTSSGSTPNPSACQTQFGGHVGAASGSRSGSIVGTRPGSAILFDEFPDWDDHDGGFRLDMPDVWQ